VSSVARRSLRSAARDCCSGAFEGLEGGDGRPQAVRPAPAHCLSQAERAQVLAVANEPRFAAVPQAREGAQGPQAAHHAHSQRRAPGVVLGHDLSARAGNGTLVLPFPDPGPVPPQDRGLVHEADHADHATHLVRRTALAEGIAALSSKPMLHGDNGATLKATTVLAMLNWLGVKPSLSTTA